MTETSTQIPAVFLSLNKLPETLPVTTLLLSGPVTSLYVSFPFHLVNEGSV